MGQCEWRLRETNIFMLSPSSKMAHHKVNTEDVDDQKQGWKEQKIGKY